MFLVVKTYQKWQILLNFDSKFDDAGPTRGYPPCAPVPKVVEDWDVVALEELHHGADQRHLRNAGRGGAI